MHTDEEMKRRVDIDADIQAGQWRDVQTYSQTDEQTAMYTCSQTNDKHTSNNISYM